MHTMTLVDTHEGTEVWECPICGHVLLVEWEPKPHITVAVPGDESVKHIGNNGLYDLEVINV